MCYFQKRMGVAVMSLYIHAALCFLKEMSVLHIVLRRPTWASGGALSSAS